MEIANNQPLRAFWWLWIGQTVSVIGSGLTGFGLGIYVYQSTQAATAYTLIWASIALAGILVAPFAGVWVDRWDRRRVMIYADSGSALATLMMVALLTTGQLAPWHAIAFTFVSTALGTFQSLAYGAIITQIVPSEKLPRINGISELAGAVSAVLAPLIAGALIGIVGLGGLIVVDLLTFVVAALMALRVPAQAIPPIIRSAAHQKYDWRRELRDGWRLINARHGLLALLVFNTAINLIAVSETLVTPLVLSFADEATLGTVLGVGGFGLILGSALVSWLGTPRKLIYGVVGLELVAGASTFVMGLRPSILLVTLTTFTLFVTYPIMGVCNQTLWQRQTPTEFYGRVSALRRMFSWSVLPLTFFLAGPLIDNVLTPFLSSASPLAEAARSVVGEGQGRGIGLMMLITGALNILFAVAAWTHRPLRTIETEGNENR